MGTYKRTKFHSTNVYLEGINLTSTISVADDTGRDGLVNLQPGDIVAVAASPSDGAGGFAQYAITNPGPTWATAGKVLVYPVGGAATPTVAFTLVADDTARNALTGLTAGDIVGVTSSAENGGAYGQYQITTGGATFAASGPELVNPLSSVFTQVATDAARDAVANVEPGDVIGVDSSAENAGRYTEYRALSSGATFGAATSIPVNPDHFTLVANDTARDALTNLVEGDHIGVTSSADNNNGYGHYIVTSAGATFAIAGTQLINPAAAHYKPVADDTARNALTNLLVGDIAGVVSSAENGNRYTEYRVTSAGATWGATTNVQIPSDDYILVADDTARDALTNLVTGDIVGVTSSADNGNSYAQYRVAAGGATWGAATTQLINPNQAHYTQVANDTARDALTNVEVGDVVGVDSSAENAGRPTEYRVLSSAATFAAATTVPVNPDHFTLVANDTARDALTNLVEGDQVGVTSSAGNGGSYAHYIVTAAGATWAAANEILLNPNQGHYTQVADDTARDALTNVEVGDVVGVDMSADNGGKPTEYRVQTAAATFAAATTVPINQDDYILVADDTARDALTNLEIGDVVGVTTSASDGAGGYAHYRVTSPGATFAAATTQLISPSALPGTHYTLVADDTARDALANVEVGDVVGVTSSASNGGQYAEYRVQSNAATFGAATTELFHPSFSPVVTLQAASNDYSVTTAGTGDLTLTASNGDLAQTGNVVTSTAATGDHTTASTAGAVATTASTAVTETSATNTRTTTGNMTDTVGGNYSNAATGTTAMSGTSATFTSTGGDLDLTSSADIGLNANTLTGTITGNETNAVGGNYANAVTGTVTESGSSITSTANTGDHATVATAADVTVTATAGDIVSTANAGDITSTSATNTLTTTGNVTETIGGNKTNTTTGNLTESGAAVGSTANTGNHTTVATAADVVHTATAGDIINTATAGDIGSTSATHTIATTGNMASTVGGNITRTITGNETVFSNGTFLAQYQAGFLSYFANAASSGFFSVLNGHDHGVTVTNANIQLNAATSGDVTITAADNITLSTDGYNNSVNTNDYFTQVSNGDFTNQVTLGNIVENAPVGSYTRTTAGATTTDSAALYSVATADTVPIQVRTTNADVDIRAITSGNVTLSTPDIVFLEGGTSVRHVAPTPANTTSWNDGDVSINIPSTPANDLVAALNWLRQRQEDVFRVVADDTARDAVADVVTGDIVAVTNSAAAGNVYAEYRLLTTAATFAAATSQQVFP